MFSDRRFCIILSQRVFARGDVVRPERRFLTANEAHLQSTRGIGLDLAVPMARNIASAMSDVHAKGMAHRDLKPSNCILAKYDNRVIKLVDFGLARLLEGDLIPPEDHDGAGTPMYQAPEVLQRKGVGLASDVFSFAIVMWEMISGEIPYEGLSLNEMKMAVLAGARPSVKPGWNKEWVDLMRSCWDHMNSRPNYLHDFPWLIYQFLLRPMHCHFHSMLGPATDGCFPSALEWLHELSFFMSVFVHKRLFP